MRSEWALGSVVNIYNDNAVTIPIYPWRSCYVLPQPAMEELFKPIDPNDRYKGDNRWVSWTLILVTLWQQSWINVNIRDQNLPSFSRFPNLCVSHICVRRGCIWTGKWAGSRDLVELRWVSNTRCQKIFKCPWIKLIWFEYPSIFLNWTILLFLNLVANFLYEALF